MIHDEKQDDYCLCKYRAARITVSTGNLAPQSTRDSLRADYKTIRSFGYQFKGHSKKLVNSITRNNAVPSAGTALH